MPQGIKKIFAYFVLEGCYLPSKFNFEFEIFGKVLKKTFGKIGHHWSMIGENQPVQPWDHWAPISRGKKTGLWIFKL